MNRDEALALFEELDDPKYCEEPPGFDLEAAEARFAAFVSALDAATGCHHPVETGAHIQDASFHSQVDLGGDWLRFSAFGEMVTVRDTELVDPTTLDTVRRLCVERGYVFIPPEFTKLPYTGNNRGVTGIRDWWIRYFDVV